MKIVVEVEATSWFAARNLVAVLRDCLLETRLDNYQPFRFSIHVEGKGGASHALKVSECERGLQVPCREYPSGNNQDELCAKSQWRGADDRGASNDHVPASSREGALQSST